jgi:small subunit ribosomal protein S6
LPTYETLFITPPNLPDEEERATVDAMAQVISDGGGTIIANDRMGRRRLGYPIRKFEDGVYVRFLYDAGVEVPKELERRIRLSDRVLRSLTVRLDREWAENAKHEAVLDAQRRVEEAERKAAEAEAGPEAGAPIESAGTPREMDDATDRVDDDEDEGDRT